MTCHPQPLPRHRLPHTPGFSRGFYREGLTTQSPRPPLRTDCNRDELVARIPFEGAVPDARLPFASMGAPARAFVVETMPHDIERARERAQQARPILPSGSRRAAMRAGSRATMARRPLWVNGERASPFTRERIRMPAGLGPCHVRGAVARLAGGRLLDGNTGWGSSVAHVLHCPHVSPHHSAGAP
jgi:hypothetical protein